jgi:putative membrane protein
VASAARSQAPPAAGDAQSEDAQKDVREFVNLMLTAGMKEIELGRIAERLASNPRVKEFAAVMVREHGKANDELRALGEQLQIRFDPQEEDIRAAEAKLAHLKGAAFDDAYMDMMVGDHEAVIRMVEDKGEKSPSEPVRQWATNTLPKLRHHLEQARTIRQERGSATSQ